MKQPLEKQKLKEQLELKPVSSSADRPYQSIECPSCQATAQADDINIQEKIAKCRQCHVVYSFQADVESWENKTQSKNFKQQILRPEGVELFHFREELEMSIQQPLTVLETFAVILLPFFAFLGTLAYIEGTVPSWVVVSGWFLSAIALIHTIVLRRRHFIRVNIDDQYLTIQWRPRKLHKDRHFRIAEIHQLYVKPTWDHLGLFMIVNGPEGQRHVQLMRGLKSISKAHFLEQTIEQHLGIEDYRVPEEVPMSVPQDGGMG